MIDPESISQQQYKEVLKEYERLKAKGNLEYLDTDYVATVILKLFMCSLQGYEDCQEVFLNIEKYLPGSTQGLLSEVYYRSLGLYHMSIEASK